jgi:hypothetical protein
MHLRRVDLEQPLAGYADVAVIRESDAFGRAAAGQFERAVFARTVKRRLYMGRRVSK